MPLRLPRFHQAFVLRGLISKSPSSYSPVLRIYEHSPFQPNRVTFADGYNASASPVSLPEADASSLSRRKGLSILKTSARLDDSTLTQDDASPHVDADTSVPPQRVSKRRIADEFDDEDQSSEKRARNESLDDSTLDDELSQDDMEVDENAPPEDKSVSRGKKRDRYEAGSVLEGESDILLDEDEQEKARKYKRRNKRKSDAAIIRGKKRDRGVDPEDGEDDADVGKLSKKKKGRKSKAADEDEKESELSLDDASSVKSKAREVGEIWESNGVRYKMGADGQRLIEALVKKSRQKFSMVSCQILSLFLAGLI